MRGAQERLQRWNNALTDIGLEINVSKHEILQQRRRWTAAWSSWRKLSGVLYDKKMPLILKSKVYEIIISPALTYGSECWPMKTNNKRTTATTEMRMLRGILGVSKLAHIPNEEIRRLLNLPPIDEIMRSGRLRWFGLVKRRKEEQHGRQSCELGATRRLTPKCDDDLLLHFPYEDHYNDVTCHQAIATQYGVGVSLQFDVDRKSNVACFTGGTHFQVVMIGVTNNNDNDDEDEEDNTDVVLVVTMMTNTSVMTMLSMMTKMKKVEGEQISPQSIVNNGDCLDTAGFLVGHSGHEVTTDITTEVTQAQVDGIKVADDCWHHVVWVYDSQCLKVTLLDREAADRPERRTVLVAMEFAKYKIDIAALCETRFSESGSLNDLEYSFFLSGKPEGERREAGVGFVIKKDIVTKLTEIPRPVSDRIMTMRLPLSKDNFATIISVYAPTMTNPDPSYRKATANRRLQCENRKRQYKWPLVMGKHGIGKCNSNGELRLALCSEFELIVMNTMFKQKD
ncbi:hypothetical protein NP493_108g03006 [Ridgeia piscesae]|uniref:Uncharacterized protein n=1 Tax=Ridgeia piscesae TaxID=27915 RepID=A0AAD9UHC0_RIDPI|nr:hypothetical protein NP493_108g03006 [Ridgeia piscesae]